MTSFPRLSLTRRRAATDTHGQPSPTYFSLPSRSPLVRTLLIEPSLLVSLFYPTQLKLTVFLASSGIGGVISSLGGSSALPPLIISFSLFLIYIADRTGFWLKEHKQFDAWNFGGLCLFFLVAGIATMKRADSDLGFLNRDQTDEWKGWMQSEFFKPFLHS